MNGAKEETEARRSSRARQRQVQDALSTLEAQQALSASALRQLPSVDVLAGRAAAQNEKDARTMSQADRA